MSDHIEIWGIRTNNLREIAIRLEKGAINLIVGPSGSGKSSLAYDTIAQIGQHELLSMYSDNVLEPTFRVEGYRGMVAAVPIRQSNFNTNIRSTIGTYFGLNRSIALVYAAHTGMPEDFFTLNKEGNLCEECHGLGVVRVLDANKIVDFDTPLENNPIRCWNRYKDFYRQIITRFCEEMGIDAGKTFRNLTAQERELILNGESSEKYSIRYKKTGSYSRRTTKYKGVLTGAPMIVGFSPGKQFYSDVRCPKCGGRRYSELFDRFTVAGLSIGDFMIMPFRDLLPLMKEVGTGARSSRTPFAESTLIRFLAKAVDLDLGHLSFNRSVPTLSGGELQRLRMVQVFNTQLTDLLIVLDEPLAALSGEDRKLVHENIIDLSNRHTLVIVDHGDTFARNAGNIIALGEGGGVNGGRIIDHERFFQDQAKDMPFDVAKEPGRTLRLLSSCGVYDFTGVDIEIEIGRMNLITGKSGAGKSTLLREYMPQLIESYLYVSQKPLPGNKTSSVATLLGIFVAITELFAKRYSKEKSFFSNQPGCDGACPSCDGSGYVEYGEGENRTRLECATCSGTGFNIRLDNYPLHGKTMLDLWSLTIDEARVYFNKIDHHIAEALDNASSLLLGHLVLGQRSISLSGGENIRIKLLKAESTRKRASVIGIDEPFRGLSANEAYHVAKHLDILREQGKTIVVVDHAETVGRYFSKHIVLDNVNGALTGTTL